jgi:uncharacterized glyoxalase superfamily protein PhnB
MTLATVFPTLRYRDSTRAADWLCDAFGFEAKAVHKSPDGTIVHAELAYGNGLVMFGQGVCDGDNEFGRVGAASVYVVVDDPDAHYKQAKAAGAEIVRELADQDYGSREYSAKDFEGNMWSFGTYKTQLAEA